MANREARPPLEQSALIESIDREGSGFWVDGVPAPKGSHRVSRYGRIYDANARGVREWTKAVVERAVLWDSGPEWPTSAPMEVLLDFHVARPMSHYGRGGVILSTKAGAWPTMRPDLDRLARATIDGLVEAKLMEDDAQVVVLHLSKRYGPKDGCGIRLRPR